MVFSHERLDVYQRAIEYAQWAFLVGRELSGDYRHAKDQLLRASQSIPLNIAEGNGKVSNADRRRFFEIARGSALECAAIQDVLEVCGALNAEKNRQGKDLLDRITAMLTRMGGRGYSVRESVAEYEHSAESVSVSESLSAVKSRMPIPDTNLREYLT